MSTPLHNLHELFCLHWLAYCHSLSPHPLPSSLPLDPNFSFTNVYTITQVVVKNLMVCDILIDSTAFASRGPMWARYWLQSVLEDANE